VIVGAQSQFDVSRDGERIFSKRLTGRFPAPGEVARLVEARP
jgi:hypothetical protein